MYNIFKFQFEFIEKIQENHENFRRSEEIEYIAGITLYKTSLSSFGKNNKN